MDNKIRKCKKNVEGQKRGDVMNNDLYIKWETGYIHKRIISHFGKFCIMRCCLYFQNRIADLTELWKENSKKYYDNKQKAADTISLIASRKHPNGLPVSKDELEQAKADLKKYKAAYNKALSDAKANKRFKEQFEKYLESF